MTIDKHLLQSNIDTLLEGKKLLQRLDQEKYKQSAKPIFDSTIGAHFRHILEHYQCLFEQLPSQMLCYDSRLRKQRLELDYDFCLLTIDEIINNIQLLDDNVDLRFKDQQTTNTVRTNVERELLFLQSHTVHHYALIAAITRHLGIKPEGDFGVAIATRVFQQQAAVAE